MQEKFAIIDIGSNTMRLVIYHNERNGRLKEIENIKTMARLRNHLDDRQYLDKTGMDILIRTLKNFEEITKYHAIQNINAVATATIRHAKNQHEIIENIQIFTNLDVKILSEFEEAYYGFLAVINSTSITEGITIDVGGGSTEVTYFRDRKLIFYHSFPFGALSLRKQFMEGPVPTADELLHLTTFLHEEINKIEWIKDMRRVPIIGIGGSARNIAQIDQRRKMYPLGGLHQYEMTSHDLATVKDSLICLPFEKLQCVEGLSEERADIIIPALEVFNVFYQITHASSFILSRKGLRDGVVYEELLKPFGIKMFPNVLEESLYELEYDYEININNVVQVSRIAISILTSLRKFGFLSITDIELTEAKRAALLFQLGRYIDDEASSQHTFYLLANRTIDGLMHEERLRLAAIASFKSKTYLKNYLEPFADWISKEDFVVIRILGAVLRLAYALNETKRNIVEQLEMADRQEDLMFIIMCSNNWQAEQYHAEKQKKQLEKVLKRNIILHFTRA
ncbi:Ppx/GppA family phosphatase [Schinkia azotoformans]|uniref:Ppx/GppA family phosphatase n=1 Tax=Schinkia azotoformans TaxID=1454 RepID=UPI002DBE2E81|nr:Ppx/GppA family phosphatase [Schinkia azotoformans]MEC1772926.1 Ppx/GppA family phosphatase [Schinkia azotoformans]MED4369238.1 Ppx/GppA family phosphatase [Schinkia azotoformans]